MSDPGARIGAIFDEPRHVGRAALIVYLMAGDPDFATTALVIEAVSAAGADLIELGVPYGDPLADGPTIAAAGQRALAAGATVEGCVDIVRASREHGAVAPLLLFTYLNVVLQYGPERFAVAAAAAGAVGAIVPDVPLEELEAFAPVFRHHHLGIPLLVAPTTPLARATQIAARSDGFTYVVSRLGVTGARREPDVAWIGNAVASLRQQTSKPIAVGFGISTAQQVRAVGRLADGVIVGSALIDAMSGKTGRDAAAAAYQYVASLRTALSSNDG